jgi:class 3 adenylate cyclase
VWFADLVGYSTLSSTDEDRALGVIRRFQAAAREAAEAHQGRIVKFLGDGALAEFGSAADAVDSARALAAAFDDPSARVRIGIHIGEIATLDDGADVYGDGVNVASRIQALAEPGQIVVSEDVRRHLRQRPAYGSNRSATAPSKGSPPRSASSLSPRATKKEKPSGGSSRKRGRRDSSIGSVLTPRPQSSPSQGSSSSSWP